MNGSTPMGRRRPAGFAGFAIVWAGQLVSVVASNMTTFAITIWAYQETGSATALGGIQTAFLLPFLLLSTIAGAMVDRYNRKLMMMVSDLVAVLATGSILILVASGQLQVWHLYAASAVNGLGNTFQWPAYSAAISIMVPKEQYSRANGMMALVEFGPSVLAPLLAGALLPFTGLTGILGIDVATFFLAIGALLLVPVPQPARTAEGEAGQGSLWREAAYGFQYIFARRPLLSLLVFFLVLNLVVGLAYPVLAPMVLSQTGNSSTALGTVQSAGAIGAVVGSLLLTAWGGFRRRMKTLLLAEALMATFSLILFALGRSVWAWAAVSAVGSVCDPFSIGSSQAIWQAKVAPDVQGRVFASRRLIAWIWLPVTPLLAGALADYVTEPAMQARTGLAALFGGLVGTGPGSGMALQFLLAGAAYLAIVVLVALFVPSVRNLEDLLPDHDQAPPPAL